MDEVSEYCECREWWLCKFVSDGKVKDWMHISIALTSVILATIFTFTDEYYCISSWLSVFLTNAYVFIVLLIAAKRSDNSWSCTRGILPTRVAGILVVFLLLVSLVLSFSGLYYACDGGILNDNKGFDGKFDAVYFSFVTITTLGYGDFSPVTGLAKALVMVELVSGILLLFCIFPFLISRLSSFDMNIKVEDIFTTKVAQEAWKEALKEGESDNTKIKTSAKSKIEKIIEAKNIALNARNKVDRL